jgi:hypothetical protein
MEHRKEMERLLRLAIDAHSEGKPSKAAEYAKLLVQHLFGSEMVTYEDVTSAMDDLLRER